MNLHKYLSINKNTLNILLNNEVFFSKTEQFNDPFDGQILPSTYLSELNELGLDISNSMLKNHESLLKSRLSQHGVLCLSYKCDDILMWSHYGDSHKGICLGFSEQLQEHFEEDFIEREDIEYVDHHPYVDIYNDANSGVRFNKPDTLDNYEEMQEALLKAALTRKHEHWKYEDETRFISTDAGVHKFNPCALEYIVFGLNTTANDRCLIEQLLSNEKWKHVKLKKAVVDNGSLGLKIIDC